MGGVDGCPTVGADREQEQELGIGELNVSAAAHLVASVHFGASMQNSAQAPLAAVEGCQVDGSSAGLHA